MIWDGLSLWDYFENEERKMLRRDGRIEKEEGEGRVLNEAQKDRKGGRDWVEWGGCERRKEGVKRGGREGC